MPPFQELFASQEFWTSIILALIGGGGVGGLVGAWSNRRKTEADIDGITADAADKAVKILTQSIMTRCRSRSPIRRSRSGIWSGCSTSISRRGVHAPPVPLAAGFLRAGQTGFPRPASQAVVAG